jgi:diguanylate cyclase
MGTLGYILPWVLASVTAGVLAGILISYRRNAEEQAATTKREHEVSLKMLAGLLSAADRIRENVDNHSVVIQESAQQVDHLHATGEMEKVKQALLARMAVLLKMNRRMEDDLLCIRYRLEEHAVEIDRARLEARTDQLTGVANRKAFDEKLHLLLDEWRRLREPFVLMLIDLDKFKWINDAHGHLVGDQVLKIVGERLKQSLRDGDLVSRYGGDEFAILLPRTTLEDGKRLADTIHRRVSERNCRIEVRHGEISISTSMGVAVPIEGDTDMSLFARVDEIMYRSKRHGRDHIEYQLPSDEPTRDPSPAASFPSNAVEFHPIVDTSDVAAG